MCCDVKGLITWENDFFWWWGNNFGSKIDIWWIYFVSKRDGREEVFTQEIIPLLLSRDVLIIAGEGAVGVDGGIVVDGDDGVAGLCYGWWLKCLPQADIMRDIIP